jgi:fibronectin type 3 domain-containing protein
MPSVPRNLTAVGGLNKITLSWEPPSYLGGKYITYYICRSATEDGPFLLYVVVDGNVTSYVDVVGKNATWFYKIYAGNSFGTTSPTPAVSASSYGPPSAPVIVSAEPGDGKVRLVWQAPSFTGNPDIAGYCIYRGTSPSELSLLHDVGLVLEYNDTGLVNGAVYYYMILAYNSEYLGSLSDPMAVSPGTTPSAPQLLPAKVGDSYANISWNPSTDDGGRAITAYELYRVEGDVPDWSKRVLLFSSPSASWYNDTSVINGHTYHYFVVAVNELGSSEYDDPASCLPCRAPDTPTGLTVEGGYEVIYLTWSVPADMGGGIQQYLIYRGLSIDDMVLIGTIGNVTSYVDEDVVVGTRYYYAVAASNWAGAGQKCMAAANSTVYEPGAPQDLTATPGIDRVHLVWERPAADGNAPLGYRIYRSASGGTEVMIAEVGDVLSYDDLDVIGGVTYSYRVAASNAHYEGDASAEASAVPYNVPSVPNDVVVERGTSGLTVTWSAPTSDNGAEVLGYRVLVWVPGASSPAVFDAGLSYQYHITGLANATTYMIKVVAYNLAGDGAESAAVEATTFAPAAAPVVTVTTGNARANVTWTVPASDAVITGYNVYRGTSPGAMILIATVPSPGLNDTGLENGVVYYYAVSAISEVGEGAMSDAVAATPSTIPGAPVDLNAVSGVGHVSLTWASPESDGGAEITGYNIYRGKTADALTWIAMVTSLGYNDTGAPAGEGMVYRVVAVNANGEGAHAEVTATALFPPPAPTGLVVERTTMGAVITWELPGVNATSAPVTGFAIYRQSSGGEPVLIGVVNGSEARSFTDADAPKGTAVYTVAALNGDVAAGTASISQGAELTDDRADGDLFLLVALAVLVGLAVLFLASFRRRSE